MVRLFYVGRLMAASMLATYSTVLLSPPCRTSTLAFSSPNVPRAGGGGDDDDALLFSLPDHQKSRARETFQALDASRMHLQILLVDSDNALGRIAEGLVARIAEYNDALFILFPASATIATAPSAPRDAAAPGAAQQVCAELGLCPFRSSEIGTAFDLQYLDDYDLVVAVDDDIRSLILRSVDVISFAATDDTTVDDPNAASDYYARKCRLLSEFLSLDFCEGVTNGYRKEERDATDDDRVEVLLDMLDADLRNRVAPLADLLLRSSTTSTRYQSDDLLWDVHVPANVELAASAPSMVLNEDGAPAVNSKSWRVAEAAMILASAGIVRFCLDTMDAHLDASLQRLLDTNVYKAEHLRTPWDEMDEQLSRCTVVVTRAYAAIFLPCNERPNTINIARRSAGVLGDQAGP